MENNWIAVTERLPEVREVKLTKGISAIVDAPDYEIVSRIKWQATKRSDGNGWYAISSGGVRMHRYILGVNDGRVVDHKDGNGLNNQRENLRVGNQSNNCVNRRVTNGKHLRGVTKKFNKFRATIKINGKMKHLGYFHTEMEAHKRYLDEATRIHGDWMPPPSPPKTETV